jgi:hypothetical protein
MDRDSFDIFADSPDRDARWLATEIGLDQARRRAHQLAAANPDEYFVFHGRSQTVMLHLNNGARMTLVENAEQIA